MSEMQGLPGEFKTIEELEADAPVSSVGRDPAVEAQEKLAAIHVKIAEAQGAVGETIEAPVDPQWAEQRRQENLRNARYSALDFAIRSQELLPGIDDVTQVVKNAQAFYDFLTAE